jgi:hypothetical protein
LQTIFDVEHGTRIAGRPWIEATVVDMFGKRRLHGFLLAETPSQLRILDSDGKTQWFRRAGPDEDVYTASRMPQTTVMTMDRIDFAKHCRAVAKEADEERGRFPQLAYRSTSAVSFARLACWATERGDLALANEMIESADSALRPKDMKPDSDLRTATVAAVTASLKERAQSLAIADADRSEMLAVWEGIASIGSREAAAEAAKMVEHYRSLIAEDKAWREPAGLDPSKLPPEQRIAYLIHRLRDCRNSQNTRGRFGGGLGGLGGFGGRGFGGGLGGQFFLRFPLGPNNTPLDPVAELGRLGNAALPALIEHLDDARPTRALMSHCELESGTLLRYGDLCQRIFETITGHTLHPGWCVQAGVGKECKAKAEKWWQDYQRLGEEGILRQGIEAGDTDSPALALKLIALKPQLAATSIAIGVRKSQSDSVRIALVGDLRDVGAPVATPYLLEELTGPVRNSRIAAAAALASWNHPLGMVALLREWDAAKEETTGTHTIVELLLESHDPALIAALATKWPERPLAIRNLVIASARDAKTATAAESHAVEDILAAALDDGQPVEGNRHIDVDGETRWAIEPSIRDLAAQALAVRFDRPGLFDLFAGAVRRERGRQAVKNEWLRRRGKEPQPVAVVADVTPLPAAKVRPLVDAWSKAAGPRERSLAAEKLEALDLAAVDALRQISQDPILDGPTRAHIASLRQRLSRIVREVHSPAESLPLPPELRRFVDELKGQPIDADLFRDIVRRASEKWAAGATTLAIGLEREKNAPGFTLSISYLPGASDKKSDKLPLSIRETLQRRTPGMLRSESIHPGGSRTGDGLRLQLIEPFRSYLEDPEAEVLLSVVVGDPHDWRRVAAVSAKR